MTYKCKDGAIWVSLFSCDTPKDAVTLLSVLSGTKGWSKASDSTNTIRADVSTKHLKMKGSDGSTETGFALLSLSVELSSPSSLTKAERKKIPTFRLPRDDVTMQELTEIFTSFDKHQMNVALTYPATKIPSEGSRIMLVREQDPNNPCLEKDRTRVADISIKGVVALTPKDESGEQDTQ